MHDILKHMMMAATVLSCLACEEPDAGTVRPAVGSVRQAVVYGEDDRQEVYRYDGNAFARASQSLVALIPPDLITKLPGGGRAPNPEPAQELLQLCADEPFVQQPAVAHCSGVLIDEDLVLTAGHCFDEADGCDIYSYVFDYHISRKGQAPEIIDLDVYGCKRLLVRERRTLITGAIHDFAVVQLDRKVDLRRRPVPMRARPLQDDDRITVMGSPQGLPAKIDSGGIVRQVPPAALGYWYADTDTFGGSSGSPAYDSQHKLAGILIRGNQDYEEDPEEFCLRAKRIASDGTETRGVYEQFAHFNQALSALCLTDEGRAREVCAAPPPLRGKMSLQCSPQQEAHDEGLLRWTLLLLSFIAVSRVRRHKLARQ